MIDLTPLDVRKKKGDFRRGLRGYDSPQVDDFLDIVADRLDNLVRENLALRERVARFEGQIADYREREKALTEALVTAQEMREEVRAQSAREADAARREAENDAVRIRAEAQRVREREEEALRRLRGRQLEFVQTYRAFLERELAELASAVRGIEMNGAIGDGFLAPPRVPEAAIPPGPAGASVAAAERWTESPRSMPELDAPAATAEQWAGSLSVPEPEPLAAEAAEPELILTAEDVLTDDDTVLAADLAPADDVDAGTADANEPRSRPESAPTVPPPPVDARQTDNGLGLDLIPELEDFAELEDLGGEAEAPPAPDAEAGADAEPTPADVERSASRRIGAGDDTEELLRSLFGDEH